MNARLCYLVGLASRQKAACWPAVSYTHLAQAQSAACAAQAVAVQAYVPPQETPQPGGEGAQQEAGAAALAQAPAQAAVSYTHICYAPDARLR